MPSTCSAGAFGIPPSHALTVLTCVGCNGLGVAKQDASSFLLHKLLIRGPSEDAVVCDYQGPVGLGSPE